MARTRNPLAAAGVPSSATQDVTSNFFLGALSAQWELDIWGRIRRSNEAARANLLATEEARRGVWLSLVSDVAQAYFELLSLDVQLQIARDSADAFQGTYNLFQDRLQFGVASRLETSRAEGALGSAQANIPELENQIVAKENQIAILLGKAPAPIPRGAPMYAQPVVPGGAGRIAVDAARAAARSPPGRAAARPRQRAGRRREGASSFRSSA